LARIAESEPGYLQLVLPLMLAGAGVSMAMPACQTVVLNGVAPGQLGKAAGTYNMFRFVGGVAGVAIGATLFAMTGSFASPHDFTRGFVAAALFSAFLSVLAAGVGLLLPGRSQRRAATNPAPASP
jgi:MFS family permease